MVEGLVETFAVGVLLWLVIPVLAMVTCGLGCYLALRAGKQRAAFRTAGLTVVLLVVAFVLSGVGPADSPALLVVLLVAAPVLARRIAAGSTSVTDRELEGGGVP